MIENSTVFVVDDDDAVARSLKRVIESAGGCVQLFSTAEEFLEAIEDAATAMGGVGTTRAVKAEVNRWLGEKITHEKQSIRTAIEALGRNELTGSQLAFGRLLVYRASGKLQSLLGGTKYVGISLETGNVWQNDQSRSISDLRVGGSLWVGMDSLLGPIYAGYGLADGGDGSFYLFLGRVFGPLRRF